MVHTLFHTVSAMPTTPNRSGPKAPSKKAILRAVASSTAIETGQHIQLIERKLRSKTGKFRDLALAR